MGNEFRPEDCEALGLVCVKNLHMFIIIVGNGVEDESAQLPQPVMFICTSFTSCCRRTFSDLKITLTETKNAVK